jgi:hypothetical protein
MRCHVADLRAIDCDVVTFGQYIQPTKKHMKACPLLFAGRLSLSVETIILLGAADCRVRATGEV